MIKNNFRNLKSDPLNLIRVQGLEVSSSRYAFIRFPYIFGKSKSKPSEDAEF